MTIDELVGKARFTVLLGKNGAGKSTTLRALDSSGNFKTKYISPERGGVLKYDPNVEMNIARHASWLENDRRKNRTEQFRPQSVAQFRNLEMLVLREIEKDPNKRGNTAYTFDSILDQINCLLPAVSMLRADRGFSVATKVNQPIPEESISSGESELFALAIEVLVFARESGDNKVLLMDEPDVHLHPDLQQRFVAFVEQNAREFNYRVVVATHSTAIIGAFEQHADVQIAPIAQRGQTNFSSFSYSEICHSILPIFGAHPLSAQFNRSPPLLVEGEDDKRVIDQVVRSSQGRYIYSPCVVGTVDDMNQWERWLDTFLPSIYEHPKGFSLRDLDDAIASAIDDLTHAKRARLNCYAMENILLCDESLIRCGFTVGTFIETARSWIEQRPNHKSSAELTALLETFCERRTRKIKDLRNMIVGLLGIVKPWEVHVGQLIASDFDRDNPSENSLREYLGPDVINKIFPS